jgi:hypothetical protein
LVIGLRAPKLAVAGAKSPIVSDGILKYSRFQETATGDWVRSTLRGGACSGISPILRHDRRQIGNAEPALRRGCRAVPRGMLTAEAVSAHEKFKEDRVGYGRSKSHDDFGACRADRSIDVRGAAGNGRPYRDHPGANDFASETREVCRSSVSGKSFSLKITKPTEPFAPARICITPDSARSGSFSRDPREEELR